ncbi:MAG: VanW family protein [Saprospiraceae bacterium]|nr:VanW family protein [Saprospiraceae bacterium]
MNRWKEIKLRVKLLLRLFRDLRQGTRAKLVRPVSGDPPGFEYLISLEQPIRPNASVANKRLNIRLAADRIAQVTLAPGSIFSFWYVVGRPTLANGFRPSRNIVRGQLSEEVGGGLCQVSGILYHLALLAGLNVMERWPHSLDIYNDEDRYAPLGADATVVFGYKDLRISNPHPFPLAFSFDVADNQLICRVSSAGYIPKQLIAFRRQPAGEREKVTTVRITEAGETVLAVSSYGKINHAS